jgi:hypothetical protein
MRFRRAASAVLALVAIATLAGCFLLPETRGPQSSPATTPAEAVAFASPGDCWQADLVDIYYWQTWAGDSPVSCAKRHTFYTYATPAVLGGFDSIRISGGVISDEVTATAEGACQSEFEKLTGVRVEQSTSLIVLQYYVPSPQEWAAGLDEVRCDAGVIAVGGSVYEQPMERLPENFDRVTAAVRDAPEAFALCINSWDSWEDGPFATEEAEYADCTDSPVWRLEDLSYYPGEHGAPFPAQEAIDEYIAKTCPDGFAYGPTEFDWKWHDYRTVECWVFAQQADQFNGV